MVTVRSGGGAVGEGGGPGGKGCAGGNGGDGEADDAGNVFGVSKLWDLQEEVARLMNQELYLARRHLSARASE